MAAASSPEQASRHFRVGGNPSPVGPVCAGIRWLPAFAGMTKLAWIALLCLAAAVTAQTPPATIVRSSTVDGTSVTVYRAPYRSSGGSIDLEALEGFALITETRTITLPQGAATIRFEGVADGIIAVSALVSGLPGGVVQKNRDAALLSPASLLDGSLGNRVHLRRTIRATGAVSEQDAIIRSGSGGALVVQSSEGLEALRCSGMPETILYDAIPSGLGNVPVLSVDTVSPAAQTVTITLTYLATGFDWSADYVLRVAEDSDRADLFGWMTVANSNRATFVDAQLLGIAGTLNIDSDFDELVEVQDEPYLNLTCYPLDGTSTAPVERLIGLPGVMPLSAPPPPGYACEDDCADIIVTGARRGEMAFDLPVAVSALATEEAIGTLRLFRVPFQTTVAAEAQKQVAFLDSRAIRTTRVYRAEADSWAYRDPPVPLDIVLKMRNRESDGLGRSIPAGSVAIFSEDGRLIGLDDQRDLTVGEDFEFTLSPSPQVSLTVIRPPRDDSDDAVERILTVTNANPFAITAEIIIEDFDEEDWLIERRQRRNISVIRGNRTWTTRVPANGSARLRLYNPDED